MNIKTLSDSLLTAIATEFSGSYLTMYPERVRECITEWIQLEASEVICKLVLEKAIQLTPENLRAKVLLRDLRRLNSQDLPKVLSMLALNLSAKDESLLRGILGIQERTQP
jgi:hypothetical protein